TYGHDLDAIATCDAAQRIAAHSNAYFTLAPGSPSLATHSATAADLLRRDSGITTIYRTAASLGLVSGDYIDALASDGFSNVFSLAPGSPTLSSSLPLCFGGGPVAIGPAYLIADPSLFGSLCVLVRASAMAPLPPDNIDALDISDDDDED